MTEALSDPYLSLPRGAKANGELTRTAKTLGAILGTIAVFTFFPLGILGIVLNCMGLDRVTSDPYNARRLMRASWITLATAPTLAVVLAVLLS